MSICELWEMSRKFSETPCCAHMKIFKEMKISFFIMWKGKFIDIQALDEALIHTLWDLYHC